MTITTFDYQVRDHEGNLITGQLEADNVPLVAERLRDMGYTPIRITRGSRLGLKREIKIPGLSDRVKLRDVAVMSRQLATMISSGLPLLRALTVLTEQIDSDVLRSAVTDVRSAVERGSSFSAALDEHPKCFDRIYVSMVQAGEVSGKLDDVLAKVATTIEKQVALRSKVRSAMTYPAIMVGVVVLVVVAMMVFVVPTFSRLYSEFHGGLPLPTKLVISVSHLFSSVWVFAVLAAAGGIGLAVRHWLNTPAGRRMWDTVRLRIPVFGPLVHKFALDRASGMLSSLLVAGVGFIGSLELVATNVGNVLLADAIRYAQAAVREGRSLGSALSECQIVPRMVTQMIETGEESGTVGEMLERVGTFYSEEIDATVNSLTSLLEPLIIVFMGAVIGVIVVSLYLPMFKYITLVNHSS